MSQAQLAQRIQALDESSTLGMTKKARELAAQGHTPCNGTAPACLQRIRQHTSAYVSRRQET